MLLGEIIFQQPLWYTALCLLLGGIYAFLLYSSKNSWSKQTNTILAILRGILVSLIAFLLLNPLLRSLQSLVDKPKVVLAIDNSTSVNAFGKKYATQLQDLADKLDDEGLEVQLQTLDNKEITKIEEAKYNNTTTNLSELFQNIKNNYEGRNLSDVLLFSDGIANQGTSPNGQNYPFRIHSIAVGDTIPKKDISVKTVVANKIAYLDNDFPIHADILANGFAGQTVAVMLKQNGQVLGQKTVTFKQADAFEQVMFQTQSKVKGIQHYIVEVQTLKGEFSTQNNRQDVYIDIIDGKEKVLILGLAPHPDLKALRAIIEKNVNFEVDVRTFGNNPSGGDYLQQKYDLIILHQIPDIFFTGGAILKQLTSRDNTPLFFVLGNQSSAVSVSQLNNALAINANAGQIDQVTGRFNPNFKLLNLDAEKLKLLEQMPPLSAPFGEYRALSGSEVILYQNIGNVKTNRPLLVINTGGARKTAVLAGEGIWQWRMSEFADTEAQMAVDELFQKTMQLISVKEDKRKFRVYTLKNDFNLGEEIGFGTEIYNDIYEKTFGQNINLELTDERGKVQKYTYTNTTDNTFKISGLPSGVYTYKANSTVNNKAETTTGQFIIRDVSLEDANLTADFGLLKSLSNETNGQFVEAKNVNDLVAKILKNRPKDRLQSVENLSSFLDIKWLFFLILALAAIEWGLRKYFGSF